MDLFERICAEIAECSSSVEIDVERNFRLRKRTLESISIIKRTLQHGSIYEAAVSLENRIRRLDTAIRERFRRMVLEDRAPPGILRAALDAFTDYRKGDFGNPRYAVDDLDILVDIMFGLDIEAARVPARREGMVHLEKTPASVVLELIDRLDLTGAETVYDLGSGLGHALLLFGLLTNAACIGIEIEEAYCEASRRALETWHIPNVRIVNNDVRDMDMRSGDVYFMYSPFHGKVMDAVLARLCNNARGKAIRVCSYGNSTLTLADESWLEVQDEKCLSPYCAAIFTSRTDQASEKTPGGKEGEVWKSPRFGHGD